MADAQLKLSRRALLGAVCAAPLAAADPHSPLRHAGFDPASTFLPGPAERRWTPDQVRGDVGGDGSGKSLAVTVWDRAVTRLRAADTALAAAAHTADEALYDRLGARHDATLKRLLRTPAPHLAALALKLDLALDERTLEFAGDAAAMKALKQDARRLAPPA
jgi:hypothetical protein